ncbi:hypothetical protein K0M31_015000, partial [Melipona bicolor]
LGEGAGYSRELVTGLTLRSRSMHPSRLATRRPRYGNGPRRGKKSRRILENGIEAVDGTRRNGRAVAGFLLARVRRNLFLGIRTRDTFEVEVAGKRGLFERSW